MPLRKKELVFNVRKKVPIATKPRGWGGAKGLSGRATKKKTFFCGFPNGPSKHNLSLLEIDVRE